MLSVPAATSSGEALRARVPETALIARHAELAGQLLPLVAVLWVAAVGIVLLHRHAGRIAASGPGTARRAPGWLRPLLLTATVVAVLAALASAVQVIRIGDAGARATWHGRVSTTPLPGQSG